MNQLHALWTLTEYGRSDHGISKITASKCMPSLKD